MNINSQNPPKSGSKLKVKLGEIGSGQKLKSDKILAIKEVKKDKMINESKKNQ